MVNQGTPLVYIDASFKEAKVVVKIEKFLKKRTTASIRKFFYSVIFLVSLLTAATAEAQYLGVTCGWQYSSQLTGPPTYPNQFNISLYNPDPANPNATWDSWAEQLAQSGVDYVCPNLTGSQPNTGASPTNMAPLLAAFINRGLTNRIKFAIFDDNAASWVAQWNQANGRGFGYAQKFDMSDTNNWKYIYDYNYKLFYQTIPDQYRFKINGRPLIIIWTGNTVTFMTNMQGNASQAILYVRQKCQADFGFNPFIVLSQDFFSNDSTCNNPGVADGSESWFVGVADVNYKNSYSLTTKNGVKIGVAVAEFQHPGQGGYLDPDHGLRFDVGLSNTVDAGALLTLCEGFTDYEEDAAMWRARNIGSDGGTLAYSQALYDYPNQRINILRKHSNWPFPPELKFEAEGCDYFGEAAGGNGKINYYRNGNIAIEPTTDAGGGYDVGWIQAGEWFEWEQVPIQGSQVHLQVRVATPNNGCQLHFVIDGTNYPSLTLPNTGGFQSWATVESGSFSFEKGSRHTVRIVCDTGGFNFNYWRYRDEIPIGANVYLQAKANSKWVSVANTNLFANTTVPGVSELFAIVDASSGYGYGHVALRSLANNNYVTGDTNGVSPLAADTTSVGARQIFQWTDNSDGTITLRSLANNKLVSATNSPSSFPLVPNRIRNAGTSESFAITLISSNMLSFVAQPNDTVVGTAITAGGLGEVQVLALDASNNPVSGVVVSIGIASGGSGTITGNIATTDDSGIAHFTNLKIDRTGLKNLEVGSSAFSTGTSDSFNITPGPQASLTIETQSDGTGLVLAAQTIAAGSPINVFAIARDSFGNYITNTAAAWSLINMTGGVTSGDLFVAGDNRSAVFTGHIKGSAKIQAMATFTAQSGVQTVVAGLTANLVVTQQPSTTAKVGAPFAQQPIVTGTDAFGNASLSPITATESGGVGNVNRNPNGVTITPVNGVGTFSGLYLTNLGVGRLVFTAGSASVQSGTITMSVGNVERLAWTTQPALATNGFTFGTRPILQTEDAGGNITTSGLPAVKYIAVSIYTGNGSLFGTVVTNIGTTGGNGMLMFSDLGLDASGTFQLIAQDIGNGYNPTNISAANSCQLWLDAADTDTLMATGSTISKWSDKSGNVNDASGSATFVTDPLLTPTSPGQAKAVHFNGSQELTMNLSSLSNSPYTILIMEVGASKGGSSSYFIGNHGGFNTDLTLGIGYQNDAQFRWQQYADDLNYNTTLTNVMPRQWTMNLNATPSIQKNLYLNSVLVGTASSAFLKGTNLANGTVGYTSYLGDIAELIVYNTSLNLNDQTNLQNYLQNKWLTGLSSAITQPFDVIDPVYQPSFGNIIIGESNGIPAIVTLSGVGGPSGGSYRVLSATNLSKPLAQWITVATNSFDASGAFSNTIPIKASEPARFYRLVQP